MTYDFDQVANRRHSDSLKWDWYAEDVLPFWVADMDFAPPPAVIDALRERVTHGIFGYGHRYQELAEVICARLLQRYRWSVQPQELMYLPGLGCGLNLVSRAIGEPGDQILMQTPIYPPFLSAPGDQQRELLTHQLNPYVEQDRLRYRIDFDGFESTITDRTGMFMLCNPHNPVGEMYTMAELTRLAEICARHGTVICADEVHCDLNLDHSEHQPIAAIDPDISQNCITLMAPSKTFNIAGLYFSFAVVQNPELRKRLEKAARGIVPNVNILGPHAALAAYRDGADWHRQLLIYLAGNRDFVFDYLARELPEIRATRPSATFLSWLDFRNTPAATDPHRYLLEHGRVALNSGDDFGPGGAGFARLNFGCPRTLLEEGLERIRKALRDR